MPHGAQLKQLCLENQNLEQIFRFIKHCQQLHAVFVSGNRIITRDLPYICHLEKLVKLDISNNGIHFLPSQEKFDALQNLQFLLLDHNEIVGWHQLEILMRIKTLRLLTIDHNPCTKIEGYRQFIVSNMANLWCLDGMIVMDFERQ